MIILGIDPGSIKTGYGVIRQSGNKYDYIACGVIKTGSGDFDQRLKIIYKAIEHIIQKYQVEVVSIEEVFMGLNPSGAIKLGMARGAAIVAASMNNLPVFEYTALQAKSSVTGTGTADKAQIQKVVTTLLGLPKAPPPDAADGLALAITHAKSVNLRSMFNNNSDSELKHKLYNFRSRGRRVHSPNSPTTPLQQLMLSRSIKAKQKIIHKINLLSKKTTEE